MALNAPLYAKGYLYDSTSSLRIKINSAGVALSDSTILFHVLAGNETRWNQLWAANSTNVWFVDHTPEVFYYDQAYDLFLAFMLSLLYKNPFLFP